MLNLESSLTWFVTPPCTSIVKAFAGMTANATANKTALKNANFTLKTFSHNFTPHITHFTFKTTHRCALRGPSHRSFHA